MISGGTYYDHIATGTGNLKSDTVTMIVTACVTVHCALVTVHTFIRKIEFI